MKIYETGKWHKELIKKTIENNIVSAKLEINLIELMGFRHFYRNAYGFMLNNENMKPLIMNTSKVYLEFKKEILKEV